MFFFSRKRRRQKLRTQPFPQEWLDVVTQRIPYYQVLPEPDRAELLGHIQVFLAEKRFEGCKGFELTDETRVTIAANACLLLLHRETDYFPAVRTILVYPSAFVVEGEEENESGVVESYSDVRVGEAWGQGVVILAWDDVLASCEFLADGYNVVIHEFAHQLDFEDAVADGTPILSPISMYERWAEVLTKNYEKLVKDIRRNRPTLLDEYAAEDPAEFFAVASETFFELPIRLKRHHADLYEALRLYYRQDPAALLEAHTGTDP